MQGRGVPSVRSPVRNLRDFRRDLDHERFVSSVVHSFAEEYGVEEKAVVVDEATMRENDHIASGVEELLVRSLSIGEAFDKKLTMQNRRGNGSMDRLLTSGMSCQESSKRECWYVSPVLYLLLE